MDEAISKYFSKKNPSEDSFKSQNSEKLNLSCTKSFREINNDDVTKDFQTPKPIKVKKISQNKKIVKPKSSVKSTKNSLKNKSKITKNPLFRATKDNFGLLDVNADHLQMALALSKSTYAVEYPELSKNVEDSVPTFLTPDKIPRRNTTLEKYGFKSDKPKLNSEFKKDFTEVSKKKNSKFRFITPTLKIRTVEERESIISTKISMVLCRAKSFACKHLDEVQICDETELCSDMLRTYKGKYSLFAINGCNLKAKEEYYNKELNISPTKSKCGCLLKKWEDIRGREKSPDRNILTQKDIDNTPAKPLISFTSEPFGTETPKCCEQENDAAPNTTYCNSQSKHLSVECNTERDCISPDLFESESESEYTPNSPYVSDFSQSLLSPSKKQQSSSSSTNVLTPPSKHIKITNTPCYDSGYYNGENISNILTEISSPRSESAIKTYKASNDDDEDTEKLYSSFLKDEGEYVTNLTQNSLSKKDKKESMLPDRYDQKSYSEECFVDLTLSSSSNDSTEHHSPEKNNQSGLEKPVGKRIMKEAHVEDFDTNFEMSPLFLKDSCDISANDCTKNFPPVEKDTVSHNNDNRYSKSSFGVSFKSDDLDNCSALLNVTDYVNQILNQNDSKMNMNSEHEQLCSLDQDNSYNIAHDTSKIILDEGEHNSDSENELSLSQESYSLSQESIAISDEELNYSSVHSSKDTKYDKNFYNLSTIEETETIQDDKELMHIDDVDSIHSELRKKYGIMNMSSPVHVRISELKGNTSLKRMSLSKELSEELTGSKLLENDANQKSPSRDEDPNKEYTPEKVGSPAMSNTTPDNNLIVKATNVTPLADYDAMDTPKIAKELEKFGLKPLKRQRGVKLLKYLYECTHPLIERESDELSSDEDDKKRVTKKRKKAGDSQIRNDNFTCDHENIEIVGDLLLKNENFDELIFERKLSVRIASCRVPLQIIWHNFLSKNAPIKEDILLYEPLQLEVLHTMIKEQTGCKFHIQDLLAFLDKKCITIRTAQGSQKGKQKT